MSYVKTSSWIFYSRIATTTLHFPNMFHSAARLTTRCDSIGAIGDELNDGRSLCRTPWDGVVVVVLRRLCARSW